VSPASHPKIHMQKLNTDAMAGSGLKSNQNLSNLPSFLGLWDLFWEKIVVLNDTDGTVYKCDVTLKLSRKTTVDFIAGRYDVIGHKRGSKPYKKFRDCGMIELKLSENVIQSELVDVATDVEQPRSEQDEKAKKKKSVKKRTAADTATDAIADENEEEDGDNDDVSYLLDDMVSVVAAGGEDYVRGIAALLVSGIMDEIEQRDRGFAQAIGYAAAIRGEYCLVSECNAAVAAVIDAIIDAVDESQGLYRGYLGIERPMSSGLSVSAVMESLLQAVEHGGVALQSRVPRFRLEGPIVDLRSLPWETEAGASKHAASIPKHRLSQRPQAQAQPPNGQQSNLGMNANHSGSEYLTLPETNTAAATRDSDEVGRMIAGASMRNDETAALTDACAFVVGIQGQSSLVEVRDLTGSAYQP
jgi:hypothetical protein